MKSTRRLGVVTLMALAAILTALLGTGSASAYPAGTSGTLVGNSGTVTQGGTLTLVGSGLKPNDTVTLTLDGSTLGTVVTDKTGSFTTTVTIPASLAAGSYGVEGIDTAGDKIVYDFTVTAPATTSSGSGSGGLAGTGVAVVGIGALGLVLLLGGGVMLMAGRRRKTTV